jgi:glycosyltransferase involved in cell wall biosynthesis
VVGRNDRPIRVLYSFPHKIGADRICTTAWHQVAGVAAAGAQVRVFPGALSRPFSACVQVRPTLALGKFRIPYRVLGDMRAFAMHDHIVARRLEGLAKEIDIVHAWPLGSLQTLRTAARLGIPTVLERPNAHTRFAYQVVQEECEHVGVPLPPGHEHAYNEDVLDKEEAEYALATRLLCPSDFVARSFLKYDFDTRSLARHQYGFDESVYWPGQAWETGGRAERGLVMLFVGGCAPRKGLHYALEAWLNSMASTRGKFLIAGAFVPGYAEKLSLQLAHPSVEVLGHRTDVPELMRRADMLVLPSVEEGSALVTSEARGSGCVLLVSDAAGAVCEHGKNALVHAARDACALTQHIDLLHKDRTYLRELRTASLAGVQHITWSAAGVKLLQVYQETLEGVGK